MKKAYMREKENKYIKLWKERKNFNVVALLFGTM